MDRLSEKLLECAAVLEDTAECTQQKDLPGYQAVYKPWHLTKKGETLYFDSQHDLAEHLGISIVYLSESFNGKRTFLADRGYILEKIICVDGKVRKVNGTVKKQEVKSQPKAMKYSLYKDGIEIGQYNGQKPIAELLGVNQATVSKCVVGLIKHVSGHVVVKNI